VSGLYERDPDSGELTMSPQAIYGQLKVAREALCRVQPHLDQVDRDLTQAALSRIALIEIDLPAGGRHQDVMRRRLGNTGDNP
jgi:hypothetical protein